MATNYVRGRAAEYKAKEILETLGYSVLRAASSHGLADLAAVKWDDSRWIQVKLTSDGDFSEDENCRKFRDLPVPPNVRKELWIFHKGKGLVEVRDLKKPKPDARTVEGKALREEARAEAEKIKRLLKLLRTKE